MDVFSYLIKALDVIRFGLFVMAGFEALTVAYLYRFGYNKFRPSKIIGAMIAFFGSLGLFFVYNSLAPLAVSFRPDLHTAVVVILMLPLGGVIYYLDHFRTESMKEQKKTEQTDDIKKV